MDREVTETLLIPTPTQLNGAVIPSTEPEKRVVPLDMFPAGMIENIRIAKTYSPDLPADFSRGLVQMQTVGFPTRKGLNFSVKSGFNTMTTFDRFLTYTGGRDFLGFGSGVRSLPALIPSGGCSQASLARSSSRSSGGYSPITGSLRRSIRPGRRSTGRRSAEEPSGISASSAQ
jgi:hypothetical protein